MFEYGPRAMGLAVQRSFDDLGTALVDTTFCVFDLETTGGSPETCRITEIGAVKVRGGEVLGEFSSLVDPGQPIPTAVSLLTGITDDMVRRAPPLESLLPAFVEFIGDAVLVAHNASFDTRFLAASLARHGYPALPNPVVCTVRLARRLVRDEVPNLRLATLAQALRARTMPEHRALADARATTDVLHSLLELGGRWGLGHLDDLLWFQRAQGHPSAGKLRLTENLPRARGVYLFRDANGRVLYVGKATDLRSRVRSYFGGDDRKRIGDLLRALEQVDHLVSATDLEASVLEARLIRLHSPPFNRAQRGRGSRWFLKLTTDRFPRISATKNASPDALGPVAPATADAIREALQEASDIRTCTQRITARASGTACVRGQIGRCARPCEGAVDPAEYARDIESVRRALGGDPMPVVDVLASRMEHLAGQARYEEAASTRARLAALVETERTTRAIGALQRAGRLRLDVAGSVVTLERGSLAEVDGRALAVSPDHHHDEIRLISAWLARNAKRVRVLSCDGDLSSPVTGGYALARWSERLKRARATGDTAPGEPAQRARNEVRSGVTASPRSPRRSGSPRSSRARARTGRA